LYTTAKIKIYLGKANSDEVSQNPVELYITARTCEAH